jgi:predicted transcriptional regulator
MTTLTLELPSELYERLHSTADQLGTSAEAVAQAWLAERLASQNPAPLNEREQVREALRAAGLLAELSPELRKRAESSTATLDEVSAAVERAGGKPLSEIVLEQRGPKE